MGLLPQIAKSLNDLDWILPTDVQAEAVEVILRGGDVLMADKTGSGKTGAFCLPIIQMVWETKKHLEVGKASAAADKWILNTHDQNQEMKVNLEGMCESRDDTWSGIRATKGVVNKGKYYYETTVSKAGHYRVGWSFNEGTLDLGSDRYGFGYCVPRPAVVIPSLLFFND